MFQKGFTLIELMIVVAIIGILSMFALPAYQDYTRRTHVSEGLALASGAKTQATEYYASNGSWPSSNSVAGLADASDIVGRAVSAIDVAGASYDGTAPSTAVGSLVGSIEITYNSKVSGSKQQIILGAYYDETNSKAGSMQWYCNGGDVLTKYRPSNCR